ncbi:MAG TPA: NADH-quinone oxidoreductase subunit M [Cyclobacteriaceae bacterium]
MLTGFLILFPLLAALLLFSMRPKSAKSLALAASLIELAASLVLVFSFDKNSGTQFAFDIPWVNSLGIHFSVGVDGISLLLVLLTTVLVPFIILSSVESRFEKSSTFYGLILMMQMALVGVFTANDGFLFYVFWELALIPIYFICLIWGDENRARTTLKFFIYTLAGSLLMLVALVYLYLNTPGEHSFDINALYSAGRSLPASTQSVIFWGLFVAFAIKMPVFPFHTWQPDTYTSAPTQGTMLLSGIMLKMGIYGLIRWLIPVVPMGVAEWGYTALILSVIGIVYASCIALVQNDIKRLIAYSSIAHVGLIAAGVMTLNRIGIQGAVIQMLSHGIVVVGLFYVVDIISERAKSRAISELGGIRNVAPVFATVFVVIMLGSVALPLTSGFVGEFLLINSLVQYQIWIGAVAGLTMILGAVYMLRAYQRTVLGEVSYLVTTFTDLTLNEKIVLYPIVVLIVVMGVYPAPLLAISEPAVDSLVRIISDATASIR